MDTEQDVIPPVTDGVMFTVWLELIVVVVPNGNVKFCGAKVFTPKFTTTLEDPN